LWQAQHVQRAGHLQPALFAAQQAARLADDAGAFDLRVEARAAHSTLLATSGDLESAAQSASDALHIATKGEGSLIRAMAARALATVEAQRGNLSAALFHFSMARNLCKEAGALHEATLNAIGLGASLIDVGDYEQARRLLDKTLATAQSLGLGSVAGWVELSLGQARHRLHEDGLPLMQRALGLAREHDDVHLVIAALQRCAMAELDRGGIDEGWAYAEEALELTVKHDELVQEPLSRVIVARALVARRQPDQALEQCVRADHAQQRIGGMFPAEVERQLVRYDALAQLDRHDQAAEALAEADRALDLRLATIDRDTFRASFREQVPAHRRLAELQLAELRLAELRGQDR
jgi:tetratricopeptide (TPR) repeat protein